MLRYCLILFPFFFLLGVFGCGESEPPIEVSMAQRNGVAGVKQLPANGYIRLAITGVISPDKTFKYYEEFIDYFSKQINHPVRLVQRENYREINDLMKLGKVDIAFVCSGAYVDAESGGGMELLVAPEVMGKTVYYSYIIVSASADAQGIKELKGKSFAFTDPLSNSGYLSPSYILKTQLGATPETFFKEIKFTYSHDISIKAVAQGKIYGAAVDSLVYEYFKRTEPELIAKTRVIHISPPYGIPPVVVYPGLQPELKKKMQEIFLNMYRDISGKLILDKLMIDKFVIVDNSLYESVRQMGKH
ncbi:MAG: phosphate/phosphite/phosphonate ABC transporter substrate-binding protein [Planctomycetes bacterium]|nr:phosphate/phosphite/phosphonate ABC transporter substrate-binding protein [Planctomycetota bacterium]